MAARGEKKKSDLGRLRVKTEEDFKNGVLNSLSFCFQ